MMSPLNGSYHQSLGILWMHSATISSSTGFSKSMMYLSSPALMGVRIHPSGVPRNHCSSMKWHLFSRVPGWNILRSLLCLQPSGFFLSSEIFSASAQRSTPKASTSPELRSHSHSQALHNSGTAGTTTGYAATDGKHVTVYRSTLCSMLS